MEFAARLLRQPDEAAFVQIGDVPASEVLVLANHP